MPKLKHALLLVHGAGRYGKFEVDSKGNKTWKPDTKGWFASATKTLEAVFDIAKAPAGKTEAFGDLFEVVEISYDRIFEQFRQDWISQAKQWEVLGPELKFLGLDQKTIQSVRKFLKSGEEDNFGWNNVLDVVLYMAPTVRAQVNAEVMKQVGAVGSALGKKYSKWSFIAHSLGTAVIHDAYPSWVGGRSVPPQGPQIVCSLSNLSRLLNGKTSGPHNKVMQPGQDPNPQSYIEGRHDLDFIAQILPFEPGWDSSIYSLYSRCVGLNDLYPGDTLNDWPKTVLDALSLPHEFSHYMYQPEVAARLWSNLLGKTTRRAEIRAAVEKSAPGKIEDALRNSLKAEVEKALKNLPAADKIVESKIIQALTDFFGG